MDDLVQQLIDGAHYGGLYGMEEKELSQIVRSLIQKFVQEGRKEYMVGKIAHPVFNEASNFRVYPLSSPLLGDCIVFSWNATKTYVWNSCMITMAGKIVLNNG